MGPQMGWINGWAIFLADVIVMASLADIASVYTFELVGWTPPRTRRTAIIIGSVVWIVADDVDLLPRHRALGAHPGAAAQRPSA